MNRFSYSSVTFPIKLNACTDELNIYRGTCRRYRDTKRKIAKVDFHALYNSIQRCIEFRFCVHFEEDNTTCGKFTARENHYSSLETFNIAFNLVCKMEISIQFTITMNAKYWKETSVERIDTKSCIRFFVELIVKAVTFGTSESLFNIHHP